jgi:hypothetical protein
MYAFFYKLSEKVISHGVPCDAFLVFCGERNFPSISHENAYLNQLLVYADDVNQLEDNIDIIKK